MHHLAGDIRQTEITPLGAEAELFVIDAHLMENRGVKVVNMNWIFRGMVAKFICRSEGNSGFHSAACKPHCEGVRVVVATPGFPCNLGNRCATKFAAPDDKRILQ
jgi:hypothetical protein